MIIAVDFDGTIVEHKYPKIGKQIPFAFDTLKQLQNENHTLILWTVREGELLDEAIKFCEENGLYFFAHNANFPEEDRFLAPRKLKADLFIDDRNFGGLPDWHFLYTSIQQKKALNLQFDLELNSRPNRDKKGWLFFKSFM